MPGNKRGLEDSEERWKKRRRRTVRRAFEDFEDTEPSETDHQVREQEEANVARVPRRRRENIPEESKAEGGPIPDRALLGPFSASYTRGFPSIRASQERWRRAREESRQASRNFNRVNNRFDSIERSERVSLDINGELERVAEEFDSVPPRFNDCIQAIQTFNNNFGARDNWLTKYLELYGQSFASLWGSLEEWSAGNSRIEKIRQLLEYLASKRDFRTLREVLSFCSLESDTIGTAGDSKVFSVKLQLRLSHAPCRGDIWIGVVTKVEELLNSLGERDREEGSESDTPTTDNFNSFEEAARAIVNPASSGRLQRQEQEVISIKSDTEEEEEDKEQSKPPARPRVQQEEQKEEESERPETVLSTVVEEEEKAEHED